MPCNDGGMYPTRTEYLDRPETLRQLAQAEAMLCMIMRKLETTPKQIMSFSVEEQEEAGVTVEKLLSWWEDHRYKDAMRRKVEAEKRRDQAKRDAALAKLTDEERKLLGV